MRTLLALVLTVAAALATWALLALLGPDWTRFAPATCLETHCFCEAPQTGALALQPSNSWSSLGFVAVGCWIMLAPRGESVFGGAAAAWFGVTAIVTGVGSVLLHATLTLWGQFADVLGMYLLSGFILVYALQRWRGFSNAIAVAIYVAICAGLIAVLWFMPEVRRWLFSLILLVAIAVEFTVARPRRPGIRVAWFGYGLLANTVAYVIWMLDNTLTLCAPDSLLQGHAIWHLLGAVAVYFNYRYYRSERPA